MPLKLTRAEPTGLLCKICLIVGAAMLFSSGCGPATRPPAPSVVADAASKVLNLSDVLRLSVGLTPEGLLYQARTECIDFFVDDAAEADLRRGGVEDEVIEGLKAACVNPSMNVADRSARAALEARLGTRDAAGRYFGSATAYMRAQRFGAAEGEIRQAIRLVPSNSDYYLLLGISLSHQHRCDAAATEFQTAARLDRNNGYLAFATLGHCFQLADEWAKARAAYLKAVDYEAETSGPGRLSDRIDELPQREQ